MFVITVIEENIMRYYTTINNVKCLEWGLTAAQGALFDLLSQLSTWAEPKVVSGEVFYFISKDKICMELPLFFTKKDTVYRNIRKLEEKHLIKTLKIGSRDYIKLTSKGKTWVMEANPQIGLGSEVNADVAPTDKYISNNNTSIKEKEIYKEKEKLDSESDKKFEEFWKIYPKQRQGSKERAREAWNRALQRLEKGNDGALSNSKDYDMRYIIAKTKEYAQSDEVSKGFAKGCAAWLNDDRFFNNYKPIKREEDIW